MLGRLFAAALLVGPVLVGTVGCSERPPAAASWGDVDATHPDAALPFLGGGTGTAPGPLVPPGITGPCGARILVVFDRSGSMSSLWDGGASPAPRWRVAADALDAALAPLADRLIVGAILFPSGPRLETDVCAPVDPIEAQLDYQTGPAFLASWNALWSSSAVGGSTPIDIAFDRADEALPDDGAVTAVVLLTDGAPTCDGPTPASAHAAAWAARGIRTWVVGLPGARGAGVLDTIAGAGGTGTSLPVDDPLVLSDALASIAGDVVDQACAP